jgi:hypothetical protein
MEVGEVEEAATHEGFFIGDLHGEGGREWQVLMRGCILKRSMCT